MVDESYLAWHNCANCGKPYREMWHKGGGEWEYTLHDFHRFCGTCGTRYLNLFKKVRRILDRKERRPAKVSCGNCDGTGRVKSYECVECNGKGHIIHHPSGTTPERVMAEMDRRSWQGGHPEKWRHMDEIWRWTE